MTVHQKVNVLILLLYVQKMQFRLKNKIKIKLNHSLSSSSLPQENIIYDNISLPWALAFFFFY